MAEIYKSLSRYHFSKKIKIQADQGGLSPVGELYPSAFPYLLHSGSASQHNIGWARTQTLGLFSHTIEMEPGTYRRLLGRRSQQQTFTSKNASEGLGPERTLVRSAANDRNETISAACPALTAGYVC
jgi:hypothetical protein